MAGQRPILLVRHAATHWTGARYAGRSDPWLSAAGRSDAVRLAAEVAVDVLAYDRPVEPLTIITSPRRRARQTARAIAKAVIRASPGARPRIQPDQRWAEVDFGHLEGRTFAWLERRHPDLAERLAAGEVELDWPGGETASAFRARVLDAWRAAQAVPGPVLVVGHGGPLRLVLAAAAGLPPERLPLPAPSAIQRVLRSRP